MKTIEPERIQPTKGNLLVRRYRRPEEYGHLVLPDSYQKDRSGKLWELAVDTEDVLGTASLAEGTVLEIRLTAPGDPGAVPTGYEDPEGRDLWVMDPEKVYGVWPLEEMEG